MKLIYGMKSQGSGYLWQEAEDPEKLCPGNIPFPELSVGFSCYVHFVVLHPNAYFGLLCCSISMKEFLVWITVLMRWPNMTYQLLLTS